MEVDDIISYHDVVTAENWGSRGYQPIGFDCYPKPTLLIVGVG
jgi:hypothetical protein